MWYGQETRRDLRNQGGGELGIDEAPSAVRLELDLRSSEGGERFRAETWQRGRGVERETHKFRGEYGGKR